MSNTYIIEMILFQGQVTSQYYISSATPAQLRIELFNNILFPTILKIDLQKEDKSIETIYSNDTLVNNLADAKKDYFANIEEDTTNVSKESKDEF